jgi:hypothetical protein
MKLRVIAGIALASAALLLTMPAAMLGWLLADTPLCLIDSHGPWWAGDAWLASRGAHQQARPIIPVSWHLTWLGAPAVAIATPTGSGSVAFGITGTRMDLPAFRIDLTTLPLPATIVSQALNGSLRGINGHFLCSYRASCRGRARLHAENLMVALFPADNLGDIDIEARADDGQQWVRMAMDGKSALAGEITVDLAQDRLAMRGELSATSQASPALARALASLKAAGTNTLSFGAHWLDGGPPSQGGAR